MTYDAGSQGFSARARDAARRILLLISPREAGRKPRSRSSSKEGAALAETPSRRELNRRAALARWAKVEDRAAELKPAHEAFRASFATEEERRAWYSEMGRKSVAVRRRKKQIREALARGEEWPIAASIGEDI